MQDLIYQAGSIDVACLDGLVSLAGHSFFGIYTVYKKMGPMEIDKDSITTYGKEALIKTIEASRLS